MVMGAQIILLSSSEVVSFFKWRCQSVKYLCRKSCRGSKQKEREKERVLMPLRDIDFSVLFQRLCEFSEFV